MFGLFDAEALILPSLQANIAEKILNVVMHALANNTLPRENGLPVAFKWFNRALKYMPLAWGADSVRFKAFQVEMQELASLQETAGVAVQ